MQTWVWETCPHLGRDDLMGETVGNPVVGNAAPTIIQRR